LDVPLRSDGLLGRRGGKKGQTTIDLGFPIKCERKMYWRDSFNVLEDLSKFDRLYVISFVRLSPYGNGSTGYINGCGVEVAMETATRRRRRKKSKPGTWKDAVFSR
jgi:hypothetical protein